ncbi:MAG: hypothetical protein ACI8T1_002167 [Verrucomicrobiales bacterium]|jgi:hypothetical protein
MRTEDTLPGSAGGQEVIARVALPEIGHNLGLGHLKATADLHVTRNRKVRDKAPSIC